jgi:YidC/Oxa1 family membrane protein insertase
MWAVMIQCHQRIHGKISLPNILLQLNLTIVPMDNKRIIVWGAAGVLLWINFVTWQRDYPPQANTVLATSASSSIGAVLPSLPEVATSSSAPAAAPLANAAVTVPASGGSKIRVLTDVLDLEINTRGGDIENATLLKYSISIEQPNTTVRLLSDAPASVFVARSGLLSTNATSAPSHLAIYSSAAAEYRLADGQNELVVPLTWTDANGVNVTKTYSFKRGSYALDIGYTINNGSAAEWQGASYIQLFRRDIPIEYSMLDASTIAYSGPAVYNGKAYKKLKITDGDDSKYQATTTGGWMANLQHYFVVAAVPDTSKAYDYSLVVDANNYYTLTYRSPLLSVPAGSSSQLKEVLFIGPKLQDQLALTGPELALATDYGMLAIIARPLFWLLEKVHQFVSNWGIAIIVTTLLIKLAFYRLTASSGRSMAKMRTVGPKMKALQERYKDDREALGRATMELYKKEKINPVAGCLPMLIQIPFFMGFYWVLLESVELRQAPFFGWITDLSARDPFFILPVIMGVANYAQFKLNPAPTDPMQAKIMAFMPLMMTVMMAWFPSGLVLYWITNTVVSALQQWRINTLVAADSKQAAA